MREIFESCIIVVNRVKSAGVSYLYAELFMEAARIKPRMFNALFKEQSRCIITY